MSYKLAIALCCFSFGAGFLVHRSPKQLAPTVKTAEVQSKALFKAVDEVKVVKSKTTTTRPAETIVEQKTTYYVAEKIAHESAHTETTSETETQPTYNPPKFKLGFTTSIQSAPSLESIKFVVGYAVTDNTDVILTTNYKFNDISAGLIFSF